MLSRRKLLQKSAQAWAALTVPSAAWALAAAEADGIEVNDVQSQLNATRVHRIVKPKRIEDIQTALKAAATEGRAVSVAGGRHAMGGQQFGRDTLLLDMKSFSRVV